MVKKTVKEALQEVDQWEDEVLVGQLFSVASGKHAAKDILGFDGDVTEGEQSLVHEQLKQAIRDFHIGAVIYFPPGGDHEPVDQIRSSNLDLQQSAAVPLLIATDQENGTVARVRVGATHLPGAMALAAADDPEAAAAVARVTADQLRAVGIAQTFAPVADVNVVPENPGINIRSFGSDPAEVSGHIGTVVRGLADGGLASTVKHFPGYGSAAVDPHLGLPSVGLTREEWDATERLPFQEAIEAGVDSVMLGHAAFPALDPENPATFSRPIVTELLRGDLGFDGVIVTDAMDMGGAERPEGPAEACVTALQAGVDQILMPEDLPEAYNAVLTALREGRLDRSELIKSAKRILNLKLKLGIDEADLPDLEVFNDPTHVPLAQRVAASSVAERDSTVPSQLDEGSPVLVIHPGADPQKRGANPGKTLERILSAAGHETHCAQWGATEEEGGEWRGLADHSVPSDVKQAVVVLRDAWKDGLPVADLLQDLKDAGMKAHVVALRSPYEAVTVPSEYPVLFTYGDNQYAIEAAGNVLIGKQVARGRIPMALETSTGK